jgi:NADPH:quinone reductase-like Zn-dependent oxidoreductase
VIYDGLGAPARDENLAALATCGHWVVYGQAGGAHAGLDADLLSAKSGTLSRPVLFHYTARRAQLESIAGNLFAALRSGTVRPHVVHRYPLAAAADAHRDLEARRTTGQVLLLP